MKLVFTDDAVDDLELLHKFIAYRNKPAARRVTKALKDKIKRLKKFPFTGRKVETIELGEILDLITDLHVVRYMVTPGKIYILRIRHQREDTIRS